MLPHNKNLRLIQILRGVAALLVVLLHSTINCKDIFNRNLLSGFFQFGGAGVDIFFVLSGFIITYTSWSQIGQPDKMVSFLRRRFVRIFPTYGIIISIFLILQILLPSFYRTHYPLSLANLVSTYLLLPGHIMINGVSWTLSYELFFYLIFCMAFLIPKKSISFTIASVYALIIILSALLGYEEKNDKTYLNLLVFPMNVEFFMGVIASILFKRISRATAVAFIWAGTVIFFLSGVLSNLNINPISNQFNRVVLFGIPSFFIITGLVKYELTSKIRVHNIFLLLGESSYTLYLIHLPVLVASFKIISVLKIKNDLVLYSLIFITIVGICYASMLFYKFVEMPIITKLNSLRRIKVANEI